MSNWGWIAIAVAAVVVLVALLALVAGRRRGARSARLREQFGPEYMRVAHAAPTRRDAERELGEREQRYRKLEIRPLTPEASERYAQQWRDAKARFVDDPHGAVRDADRLVQQVLTETGYPDDGFEQRAADISVEHPHLAVSFRSAHEILEREASGTVTTEELRYALVDYRALVREFLAEEEVVALR